MRLFALITACVLIASGCGPRGPKPPELYPVSGTVTLDGKPLAGAIVSFVPTGRTPGQGAAGTTASDGKYTLETRLEKGNQPGVPAGEYKVLVSRTATADGKPVPQGPDAPAEADSHETLPKQYSDFNATILKAEVPEGGKNPIDFALKSRP